MTMMTMTTTITTSATQTHTHTIRFIYLFYWMELDWIGSIARVYRKLVTTTIPSISRTRRLQMTNSHMWCMCLCILYYWKLTLRTISSSSSSMFQLVQLHCYLRRLNFLVSCALVWHLHMHAFTLLCRRWRSACKCLKLYFILFLLRLQFNCTAWCVSVDWPKRNVDSAIEQTNDDDSPAAVCECVA